MKIELSLRSQNLIKKYFIACGFHPSEFPSLISSIDLETLLSWLNKEDIDRPLKSKKKHKKAEFVLLSLHFELLSDLFSSIKGEEVKSEQQEKNSFGISRLKLIPLTMAGILVAACQGFDGIVTMLSIFTLSPVILFGAGFIFSFLSVAVFCGFDLVKVSNNLGFKLRDTFQLLAVYLQHLQEIKAIRKKINAYCLTELSLKNLKQLEEILSMLQKRLLSLAKGSKQFDEALKSENMRIAKAVISGVSALLVLGNGFFAGQSVALFISSMVFKSMTSVFLPVIIFSTVVGLAALSVYWYVDRPVLNKLVSSWFGLNEETITKLCDEDLLVKEENKLKNLKEKVNSTIKLSNRVIQLEQGIINKGMVDDDAIYTKVSLNTRTSANFYSFLKSPDLLSFDSSELQNQNEVTGCCFM